MLRQLGPRRGTVPSLDQAPAATSANFARTPTVAWTASAEPWWSPAVPLATLGHRRRSTRHRSHLPRRAPSGAAGRGIQDPASSTSGSMPNSLLGLHRSRARRWIAEDQQLARPKWHADGRGAGGMVDSRKDCDALGFQHRLQAVERHLDRVAARMLTKPGVSMVMIVVLDSSRRARGVSHSRRFC